MRLLYLIFALIPGLAFADEWRALRSDAAIVAALAGRTLVYDAYTMQHFGAGGDTQYITERMSEGRWAARAGQYCSVWPPSDIWACYDIQINGEQIRFIGADRSESTGTYRQ